MGRPEGTAALDGRRVLVVEDEMLIAMEFEALLREHGCDVVGPAPSVERALTLLQEQRPELVLMDLDLNGKSALPLAWVLRQQSVPFVVVTGYSERHLEKEPVLRDIPRLSKPVRFSDLLRTLVQTLTAPPRH